MRLAHPTERLHHISQTLCRRLADAGVETVPEEISYVLLAQTDFRHMDAINNGKEYLRCSRPIMELVLECSNLNAGECQKVQKRGLFGCLFDWIVGADRLA